MLRLWALLLPIACVGCASGAGAVYDSMRTALSSPHADSATTPALRPELQYLHVTQNGQTSRLALGYRESMATAPDAQAEVWFAANGNLIKLYNGHLVASTGLATNWRAVRWTALPQWSDVPAQGVVYERERDVMPGYRYGLRDRLHLRPMDAPPALAPSDMAWHASDMLWFEETDVDGDLPTGFFAVDPSRPDHPVVFSHQCLSPDLCLSIYPLQSRRDGSP